MAQVLGLKIKGLYTSPNPFSEVPEGALAVANNVVIDEDSIAKSRRGFGRYGTTLSASLIENLFEYRNRLLAWLANGTLYYDSNGSGTWVAYSGTYAVPESGVRIRSVQANRNFYFTTSTGVQKLDSLTGTVTVAGGIKALGGSGTTTGSAGWLPNNSNVAYRIVWKTEDANQNEILGAPSGRIVVSNNAGGARDVQLTFAVPSGVTTDYSYQIYRSPNSGSLATEPSDEMQLVYEAKYVSGTSITVTDSTPDALKGQTLYTSPSQEGIALSNEPPPFCKDLTAFKGSLFAANTRNKQRLFLTMLGVGAGAVTIGTTVTIAGVTYTGESAEDPSANEFLVGSTGDPADDIEITAQSLVRVINASASNTTVYAYYTSGFASLPGQMLIEERSIGGGTFSATSNAGSAFSPALPTSGTSVSSENDEALNGVSFSKPEQPEAWPIPYFFRIGSADAPIRRILPLRDSLFVLKDDGIFRIVGEDPGSYRVSLFDNTTTIRAPESAVVLNNQIFMFSDQGVAAVSESGVQILSRPIEQDLLRLSSSVYANFQTATYGVSYESERKYILWTVTNPADTAATQAFVYNLFTQTWTTWTHREEQFAGRVLTSDNKLYLSTNDTVVWQERKDYQLTDYADDSFAVTVTGVSGTAVSLSSTTGLAEGWLIEQGSLQGIISSVDSATQVTLVQAVSFANGAATAFEPITNIIEFTPLFQGNPGVLKHYREITTFFRDARFDEIELGFANNFVSSTLWVEIEPEGTGVWGNFPWGSVAWGGGLGEAQGIRTFVPANRQRSLWLKYSIRLSRPFNSFSVQGLSLVYEQTDTRFRG